MGDDAKMSASPSSSRWSDLGVRAASGVVMAVVGFALIWIGGWPFKITCIILGLVILWEWWGIVSKGSNPAPWIVPGIFYALLPVWALIYLRTGDYGLTPTGATEPKLTFILSIILLVIVTDVGAYFAGRMIGGPKLAPRISPKKTWAGFVGGIVLSVILCVFITIYILEFQQPTYVESDSPRVSVLPVFMLTVPLGIFLSIFSQIGDLFESWLKRKFNVKDSSNLIPGHGGVMDRLDGLIFVAPVAALIMYLAR
jgi:phosphatidate cytidylyltransferase